MYLTSKIYWSLVPDTCNFSIDIIIIVEGYFIVHTTTDVGFAHWCSITFYSGCMGVVMQALLGVLDWSCFQSSCIMATVVTRPSYDRLCLRVSMKMYFTPAVLAPGNNFGSTYKIQ
jgi:hypothetical protein